MIRLVASACIAPVLFALGVWEGPIERHRVLPSGEVHFSMPDATHSLRASPLQIRISLDEQRISVISNEEVVAWADITTGASHSPTPTGSYFVIRKEQHYRSVLFDADMPHALFLTEDGIAIHGGTLHEGPMTGGCVRVPFDFARWLFRNVPTGTEIMII